MIAFIRGLVAFFLVVVLTVFAVANMHSVDVSMTPVHQPFQTPLYLIALGFMAAGFVVGGFFVWLNGSAGRSLGRQQKRQIKVLEKELGRLQEESGGEAFNPSSEFFPALPISSLPKAQNPAIKRA
ncbi:MAG: LapA family protein [Alphaproteobacteria bacterium]|nr:LapA family protein [Alphaproteobacteria bacterium]